jgi:co-chaperonin GroES (HSP10)
LKGHVIIRREKPREETVGGILLPKPEEIPQTWGQILKVNDLMDQGYDTADAPAVAVLDYVIYDPSSAVPLDVEVAIRSDLRGTVEDLYVVPLEDLLAVYKAGESYGD